MKKAISAPADSVQETVEGIIAAYGDRLTLLNGSFRMVTSNQLEREGKVGVATGGGSGYLPLSLGYVGDGMVDGCAVGDVFASPSAGRISKLIRVYDFGSGVLCLYGNYRGDNMNFKMACDEAEFEDIETRIVTAADDVASAPTELTQKRRGMAGPIYACEMAGTAADERRSLDEVAGAAKKAPGDIRSVGVALSPCVMPGVGGPTFFIPDDEIEIGTGIHGEKGIEVCKMLAADETTAVILKKIVADMQLEAGDEISVMISGLGATPPEEWMILYRAACQTLDEMGVSVFIPHIGELATSMEMAGLSVIVLRLDKESKRLLHAPASTPLHTNADK